MSVQCSTFTLVGRAWVLNFCHVYNTQHSAHCLVHRCLLLQDEGEERELRKVEMQTQKAENMIEHEAEIYARPPRTWFQTEKQKKESAKRARPGGDEDDDQKGGKRTKKQNREDAKGKKEKGSKEDRGKKQKDKLTEVTLTCFKGSRGVGCTLPLQLPDVYSVLPA